MAPFSNFDAELERQAQPPRNTLVDAASIISASCFAGMIVAILFDASISFFIAGAVGAGCTLALTDPSQASSSVTGKKALPPRKP